ncbi:MAG TPA: efflux RND transporter periplasmic adaptor subunit [Flavitalea sp.]|nr:efflux RND transporter periplasmic adaptor subunit [Flavitalea sp.]
MLLKDYRLASLALLLLVLLSCENKNKNTPQANAAAQRGNRPMQAEGFIVKTKSLSENIEVPGTLLPFEETEIRPEISGRIVYLNVPEGRFVTKGTILAKLFDGDLQAQLKKLQVQLEIAQQTASRYKELLKIGGVSQQEYDLTELQVNNLNADIELVRVDIYKTNIRAPYSGRIGLKSISNGAYVTPVTIITTISQVSKLKMEFTVPEKYSDNMRRGRIVNFTVSGSNNKFTSSVMATESNIEANTRTLKVRSVVDGNHPSLVPGAFAKVTLEMDKNDEALVIPTQAVIPQARNKRVILYRNGEAKFEIVSTGIRDSSFVQITEGLKAGDTVVTTGLLAIRPDSKIQLSKIH